MLTLQPAKRGNTVSICCFHKFNLITNDNSRFQNGKIPDSVRINSTYCKYTVTQPTPLQPQQREGEKQFLTLLVGGNQIKTSKLKMLSAWGHEEHPRGTSSYSAELNLPSLHLLAARVSKKTGQEHLQIKVNFCVITANLPCEQI